ncbi:J domain-containing protein [Halostella sp. JP-L12]|uniref:J domain-containing protein n=1 Tax=Halostella TaxID=1843185 RepID=UPI000EF83CCA|nr:MULTISPECIES: J domain-containing protein [Halostella]NHN47257.1 J domain-containing protein [Halostella sp. JP-L12]
MPRATLLVGLSAVFAGLAAVLGILTLVQRNPFVLILAAPFAFLAYVFWYQGTGKLAEQARRRTGPEYARSRDAGFGAGARRAAEESRRRREARQRYEARESRRRARRGRRRGGAAPQPNSGPSEREAYEILGVDPGASEERVRRAYREKVKETHPDAEGGDEERFKRVAAAYDRLTDADESRTAQNR